MASTQRRVVLTIICGLVLTISACAQLEVLDTAGAEQFLAFNELYIKVRNAAVIISFPIS